MTAERCTETPQARGVYPGVYPAGEPQVCAVGADQSKTWFYGGRQQMFVTCCFVR